MITKTRNIHHIVIFEAEPRRVFDALMDSAKHAKFTQNAATIHSKEGGSFTCYGGYIKGITLELEPNKRIVQAWRSRNWPKNTYSIVTFNLRRKSAGKTELEFSQIGIPADDYADKNKGWRTHYWQPLRAFLQTTAK